jgi:hypothetical protein
MEGTPPQPPGWDPPTQQQPPAQPPQPPQPPSGGGRNPWPYVVAAVVALALLVGGAIVLFAGDEEAEAQTVRFQAPTEPGPDPFTRATDVRGKEKVEVGSGPFGGTGSDLVCDRELLIESLQARPDRLREWARIIGVDPTPRAVARYIRTLRPVTLTTDVRVTNHSFVNGRAVPFQSILQAGTAVLVDRDGNYIARCRCGNPLAEPIFIPEARCLFCPDDYVPPRPCDVCYRRYPNPPPIIIIDRFEPEREREPEPEPEPPSQPALNPAASFSPRVGGPTDTYVLTATGFRPGETINVVLVRPDGVREDYSFSAGSNGSGSYTFPNAGPAISGTYNATLTGASSGVQTTAQTTVQGGGDSSSSELNCDAPSSQLEFEQCRDAGQLPEQQP